MKLSTLPARVAALALLTLPVLAGGGTSLDRALESVSAERIQADVDFIASDEMAGRDTPSEGLQACARFLRSRLVRLGWQPGAEDGYFHYYDLSLPRLDAEAAHAIATVGGEERVLTYAADYWFYSLGVGDLSAQGGVVFCGGGDKKELADLDLTGKWALCMDGREHWKRRERYARKAGAIGVIAVAGADYDDDPYAERFERQVAGAQKGRLGWPSKEKEEREPPFPQTFLSADTAKSLFPELFSGAEPAVGTELAVTFAEERALDGGGLVQLENVCGFWPGEGPLADEVIVLSAHYDHVGTRGDDVYNGADDNGSGTTALLAVAEALAEYGPMKRSVMLIWVSGEEKGLLGSRAWTENPWLPNGARAVCNINVDMVGRNDADYLLVTPTKAHDEYNGLTRLAEAAAPLEGFGPLGSADAYWSRSDHANFARNLDIPVAFLFSDVHEDYHKATDTPDKIDADKIRRVVRVLLRMLEGLQTDVLVL